MDALGLGVLHRLVDGLVDHVRIHGVRLRDGVRHQHTAPQPQLPLDVERLRQLCGAVQPVVHTEPGLPGVERRQLLGLIPDDRHAVRLQILQRQPQIENGLCTGADDHDWRLRQLLQVGGNIHGSLRAPVHAADAAGGKHLDPRHGGDHHGGGHGGGAVPPLRH